MNEVKTVLPSTNWLHTILHIVSYPLIFILVIFFSDLFFGLRGDHKSIFSFATSGIQVAIAMAAGLCVPTYVLDKSKAQLVGKLVGAFFLMASALFLFSLIISGVGSSLTFYEWLRVLAMFLGGLLSVIWFIRSGWDF